MAGHQHNSSNTKKPKKVKKGTPPPVDKLLKPAIGVALALVAYQFFRGLGSGVSFCISLYMDYVFMYLCECNVYLSHVIHFL